MPKTNNSRISQVEWDDRKDTIKRLYLSENKSLMGENGVIELMKQEGFFASKPQYESQFLRWGFKKKLARETWHAIWHLIRDRDEAGPVSHLYAYGIRISDEKVKKETSRYKSCITDGECCATTELPTGVELRTDQEEVEGTTPSPEAQRAQLGHLLDTPHPRYRCSAETRLSLATISDLASINGINPYHSSRLSDLSTLSTLDNTFDSDPFTHFWPLIPSPLPSPSQEFRADVSLVLSPSWRPKEIYPIPLNTISLFKNLNMPLFREFKALLKSNRETMFASIHQTKHLLPSEPNQELQKASVDIVILKQILYLLMNNFAGSDYAAFDTIFEQVKQFPISQMEDILNALPHPYAAALEQSILTIAIKSNIPGLVEILIRRGLDIHMVQCRFQGVSYSPLCLACKFRRLEIVEVLLREGADPNDTVLKFHAHSPMNQLLYSQNKDDDAEAQFPPIVCNIFQCLLEHGAMMGQDELMRDSFWDNEPLVDLYIHHSKHPPCFYENEFHRLDKIWEKAANLSDPEKAIAAICTMLGANYDFDESESESESEFISELKSQSQFKFKSRFKSQLKRRGLLIALRVASCQDNPTLANYLLEIGVSPNSSCLSEAVRGNNFDLVKIYVQLGADIHGYSATSRTNYDPKIRDSTTDPDLSLYYSDGEYYTTPIAECIRWNRQEMSTFFENLNPMHASITEQGFNAAVYAAAEVGNKEAVQKLLKMSEPWYRERNTNNYNLIEAAVMGGHDEIVEILMLNGIPPNCFSVVAALLTHNTRLVQLFLDTGVPVSTYSDLAYLAVCWGNQAVLELLIDAGVGLNELDNSPHILSSNCSRHRVSPLREAIRRGDHHIFQLLLEKGAKVSMDLPTKCVTLLTEAINCDNEVFALELLARGADPNDPAALQAAAIRSLKIVEVIMTSFHQRYPNGEPTFVVPTLRQAIKDKNKTIIKMLASQAALNDVHFVDQDGVYSWTFARSLLGEAIVTCSLEIVSILLRSGGDPNSTVAVATENPRTGRLNAVLIAISTGNLAMVQLLSRAGADLTFSATLGITHTSLQLAVEKGHFEIVQYLLNEGVDVNAPPCIWEGGTALQFAAKTGSARIVEMLLEHGANIDAAGSKYVGRTAFEFAAEHGRMDMLLLLFHRHVDIVSDGGEQIRRACKLAEENGQIAARDLVMQLSACVHGGDTVTMVWDSL